jgi:hypothetical protein
MTHEDYNIFVLPYFIMDILKDNEEELTKFLYTQEFTNKLSTYDLELIGNLHNVVIRQLGLYFTLQIPASLIYTPSNQGYTDKVVSTLTSITYEKGNKPFHIAKVLDLQESVLLSEAVETYNGRLSKTMIISIDKGFGNYITDASNDIRKDMLEMFFNMFGSDVLKTGLYNKFLVDQVCKNLYR